MSEYDYDYTWQAYSISLHQSLSFPWRAFNCLTFIMTGDDTMAEYDPSLLSLVLAGLDI